MRTALVLVLAVGCASPMSAVKDDNRRLSQTVSELRADRRAQERRVRDLQRQLDLVRAHTATAAGAEAAVPELRVEVAAPAAPPPHAGSPRIVGIADDGSEIVYEGDAAAGKQATLVDDEPAPPPAPRARPRADRADRIEPLPHIEARPSRVASRASKDPSVRTADAGNDYRAAVELVKAGSYTEGAAALRAFLGKFPRHDFADNAQYWLGEAFYAQKDYPHALTEFRTVVENYPRGNKVPDALLKVGYCYQALGQLEKTRAVLEQVVNLYPKTEPAATAAKRLETL